jgi:hypothetical protein
MLMELSQDVRIVGKCTDWVASPSPDQIFWQQHNAKAVRWPMKDLILCYFVLQ